MIDASVSASRSQYNTGLLFGLGMERMILEHVNIGLEYVYVNYGTLSYPSATTDNFTVSGVIDPTTTFTASHKVNLHNNTVFAKISYYIS